MLRRSAGQTKGSESGWATFVIIASVVAVVMALTPGISNIFSKEKALDADNTVSLVADYDDLVSYQEGSGLPGSLEILRLVPVNLIRARIDLPAPDEKLIRDFGFNILWRVEDGVKPDQILPRILHGDSVVIAGDAPIQAPRFAQRLAEVIKRQAGLVAIVEFAPIMPLDDLPDLVPDRLVRFHLITSRETTVPHKSAWAQRFSRGAKERWVRLSCFRFSSTWTNEQNLNFFTTVATVLRHDGFLIGPASPVTVWKSPLQSIPFRPWLSLALGILGPLAIVAAISQMKKPLPVAVFTGGCLWSVAVGTAIHGLLASPMAAVGLTLSRGVKAELLVPLTLGAILLLTRAEIRTFLDKPIRWKDVIFGVSTVVALVAVYLMRSGNLPVLPVSDNERGLRDVLEVFLGVRPRFKEFAIGHPLLIAGLNRFRRQRGGGFLLDGRALVAAGLIGQISIVNTFVHVQAPYEAALLRTFHGWWIGILVSIPLSWWLEWRFRRKTDTD